MSSEKGCDDARRSIHPSIGRFADGRRPRGAAMVSERAFAQVVDGGRSCDIIGLQIYSQCMENGRNGDIIDARRVSGWGRGPSRTKR